MFTFLYLYKIFSPILAQYGFEELEEVPELEKAPAETILVNIIGWIVGIIGLICIAFIIYGGVIYATSGGSEEQVNRGKKILLWSIIGLVICILAYTIARTVVTLVRG